MVIIEEVEINNCFSIENLFLRFENNNFVTILNSPVAHKYKDALLLAIQPFLLEEFSETFIPINPGGLLAKSNVRIKFIIPKGKFPNNIIVDALRTAQTPAMVYYYFDSEQYIDHIKVYHRRCRIDVTNLFPCLNEVFTNESKNLMGTFIQNECSQIKSNCEKSNDLLDEYFQIFNSRPESEIRNIVQLTQSILKIDKHIEHLQKRNFFDVANNTAKIFNYITFEKYSIHFCIPLAKKNVNIHEMLWEDMDLSKSETHILNLKANTSVLWNSVEVGLKYLLKISQQIALAKCLGQHGFIIEDSKLLQDYQEREMIKEAVIESVETDSDADWKNKNILNRIVNVCNEMEISFLLNYHGGLPLIPENANIIKFRGPSECSASTPPIYLSKDSESMSLNNFIQLLSQTRSNDPMQAGVSNQ